MIDIDICILRVLILISRYKTCTNLLTTVDTRKRAMCNYESIKLNKALNFQIHFRYFRFYAIIMRIVFDGTMFHYSEIKGTFYFTWRAFFLFERDNLE